MRMRSSDDALLDILRMRGGGKLLVLRSCQIYHTIVKFTILLSVLLRMRSRKKLLVWRSCHVYHTFVRCTALLSILLRMRSSRDFLVLRSCQIYHTIVKCTRLFSILFCSWLIYCARTSEFATKFQDKNRLVPALRVLTRFTGCKQCIVEMRPLDESSSAIRC